MSWLTWLLLALIPVTPVVLALWPGLDEPRNGEDAAPPPARDDTRLDDPREVPRRDPDAELAVAA